MNLETLPPLPPACEFFFEIKGDKLGLNGIWFSPYEFHKEPASWSHDSDFPILVQRGPNTDPATLGDMTGPMRKLIACVARCAWADEAKRLTVKTCNAWIDVRDEATGKVYTNWLAQRIRAEDNADLWKIWGEKHEG